MHNDRKVRVLHIFGRMDRGGAETWIMNVYRNIDRERFRFDFLVADDNPGAYDDEIRHLGGEVIVGPSARKPLSYVPQFLRILRKHGPYNAIHSHVHHFSGITLALARAAAIPVRIAHSHNDLRHQSSRANAGRRLYNLVAKTSIRCNATTGLAASDLAAVSLFGDKWADDPRWAILRCGIDLSVFTSPINRQDLRNSFGIESNDPVIGHVGSFTVQKNHSLLIDIFADVLKIHPTAKLILVGSGPLEARVRQQVSDLKMTSNVLFAGIRSDVPELMRGLFDVLVLPSLHEGLPVVSMESQAAGIPTLLSNSITSEASIVSGMTRMLPISDRETWVNEISLHLQRATRGDQNRLEALAAVRASDFNVEVSVARLMQIYGCTSGVGQ